jgi:uncharacterized Rmd1/YagE family protein
MAANLPQRKLDMENQSLLVRALQLGERIDLRGLERDDSFSKSPLAFPAGANGTAILFKSGTAVFINMSPVEEEDLIDTLGPRITDALSERETESAKLVVKPEEDELIGATGAIQLKSADNNRLLLVGQALAMSTALAWDEKRISKSFERTSSIAAELQEGKLPQAHRAQLLKQIGEAMSVQQRLASRVDLDDKPDVLWDHPELERFWAKLVEEYDLPQRGRALSRKLEVIHQTAGTITDLISTRTGHRLEWYIIVLILFEIVLGLYDRLVK